MGQDRLTVNALIVLGMHRSGTSALTRVLSLLGAELPRQLMPPNPLDNETGFWEPVEIVKVHDELLGAVGSRWDDVVEFPRDWFGSPMAETYVERLADLVRQNYKDCSLLVLKDPRLCQLVPLWVEVLGRLKIQPHFVIPIRNPLEVAASLKKRNGFPIAKSAMLWLRHALDSERNTRGHSRCFTSYDQLLTDWKHVTDRIASELGLQWPRASTRAGIEIEAFLSDSLRHNRSRPSELREHSQVIDWVKQAYAALLRASRGDTATLATSLDRIRAKLQPADRAFGPILMEASILQERNEAALRAAEDRAQVLSRRQEELETESREQIAELGRRLEEARGVAQAKEHHLVEVESRLGCDLAALSAERTRLEAELQAAHTELQAAHAELQAAHAELQAAHAELQAAHAELQAAHTERTRLQGELQAAGAERTRLEADRHRLLAGLEADRHRLLAGLEALDTFWARVDRNLENAAAERARLIDARIDLEATLRRTEAERDAARADRQAVWQVLNENVEQSTAAHAELERQYWAALADRRYFEAELERVASSRFWKVTRPIRSAANLVQRARSLGPAKVPLAVARRLPGPIREPLKRFKQRVVAAREERRFLEELAQGRLSFPGSERPTVSIIIPVHNHVQETMNCLMSIRDHVSNDSAYEVIVVDDASTDATRKAMPLLRGLVYHRNAVNLGFIGSCNAGAEIARGEFLVFLNNDTVVTPAWLEELLRTLREEPDAGLVGSRLVYPDGRLQEAGGIIWSDAGGWNFGRLGDPNDPEYCYARDVDYCSGASIMLRKALFDQLGGFDTRFMPAYYEDTDLAFQIRGQGLRVLYQPLSVAIHFEGLSSGTDTSTGVKAYQVQNQVKFREKWADVLANHPAPCNDPYSRVAPGDRVLVIDHIVPTPDQDSGSLRMARILQILRCRGLSVTFLPDHLPGTHGYTQDLQRIGVKVPHHPYISSVREYLEQHGHRYKLVWISRPDIVGRHLDDVRRLAPQARVAFDTVDLHFIREAREAALNNDPERAEAAEQRREQELAMADASDFTLVVSQSEADVLLEHRPALDVRVVTNIHEPHHDIPGFENRSGIVFIGGFNHPPNVDAIEFFVGEVFPEVRRRLPGIIFTVLGSHPPQRILDLACEDVIVTGFIPDVTDYFRNCRLSVAPLRYGAGVKGKVNMSLAFGVPAVVTMIAAEGMHLVDGRDALITDDVAAMADAVVQLYQDRVLWQRLSRNGLKNIEDRFSTRVVAAKIGEILQDVGLLDVSDSSPTLRMIGHAGVDGRSARLAS